MPLPREESFDPTESFNFADKQRSMKKFKKIGWAVAAFLVLLVSFYVYWNYYNTYSEGNRSGILQKFSKKGNVFKTYEGELIMSSIATTGNTTIASEKFYFSVKDETLANSMFAFEGKHVTVTYQQKRKHFSWDGETDYFVTGIRADTPQ